MLSATEVAQLFMYEAPSKMPIISAQPLAGGVGVSGRFDLSVTAVGGDLSYQWRKNGVNIEGANGSAFSIASAQASDAGVYDVLVSNGFGSVTSSGATLTVSGLLPTASPLPGGSPVDYAIYVSKIGNDTTGTGALGNPFLTITKAVGVAPSDSRILVSAGTYSERVEFVGKTLRLHSLAGPALTTIQGVAGNAVVYIDEKSPNSELRGFRITGGTGRPTPSASGTDYLGGGVHCRTTALISDCIIDTNGKGTPKVNSGTFGGAIYSTGGELTVVNCLLTGNYAWACGGATYTENGSVQFDRCTVFGNTATQNLGLNGGLAVGNGGGMVVKNCIVYGNVGAQLGAFGAPNNVNTAMTVEYSDIQGTLNGGGVASFTNGTGNLGADPQFVDTTKLEFVLKASSPALNAGNPATPADPDGSRADMGWRADRYSVETLIYVTKTGDDAAGNGSQGKPYLSIGKAIAAAPSGARIFVGPGIYAERVDYGAKTLRIHSTQGADFTTIVGTAGYSAVSIGDGSAYSELRGFRVTGGQGSVLTLDGNVFCGGGVYCGVTAYISDCIISGNGSGRSPAESATYGGGIYSTGGAVTVVNCLIYDNFAWYNGGAVYTEEGTIELDRCTVSVNNIGFGTGQLSGVAVATGGKVEVRNSIVWGNGSQGVQIGVEAAPRNADTEVFVEYSDIEGVLDGNGATVFREGYGNIGGTSDVSGDPLFVDVAQANFTLQTGSPGRDSAAPGLPSDEDGTSADMGWRAGRYSIALELYVSKSGNDTTGTGTLAKPYLTISKAMSVAPAGAWVLVGSGTYAERVQFSGKTLGLRSLNGPGSTTIQGGSGNTVVSIDSAAVNSRVQGFRITGGTGKPSPSAYGFDYYGGGVHCVTTAFLSDCIIDGNGKGTPRVNSATFGGAIYSGGGKLTVTNCLITGNYAWASGGATLTESGTIEFDRCTVQGNDATVFVGQQGGLAVANGGQMIVKNSIVYGNTGSQVGAFGAPYNAETAISVEYSDIQGTIDGGGARSLTRGLGNIGAEPMFANIATKDFALKAGSPAIDTANPNAPRDNDGTRADMGWRQDRYYVGGALRKAPVLAVTSVPANASKVLLPLDSAVVIVSGTVTHESGVDSVVFERTTGTLKESTAIAVTELPPVLQGGKTLRVWEWSAELPFETFGKCDYAVYAVDQTNLKSAIVAGSFTAAQAARVVVVAPAVDAGTITVTPAISANTLVEVGQTLQIVAAAKPGYLFRLLEVDVDGLPEDDITRSSVALVVKADTVITPQFIVNPFPALAGSWSGLLQDGWTSGLVTVTMGRTGAYSIRVVSGRNAFSFSGVMDASGRARIVVPTGFWPYSETKSGINSLNSSVKNPFVATLNLVGGKLRFSWGDGDSTASGYGYAELGQAVGGSAVTKLPSRRYTAALWRCVNTYMDPSNTLLDTGFFTADLTTSGAALGVGSAKVSDKVVRFSFSGNLIANGTLAIVFGSGAPAPAAPSKTLAANTSIAPNFGGGTVTGPILNPYARNFWDYVAVGLSLNYYAVTSSSDLVAHGAFGLNGTELRGPLSTRRIRTGALDPLADAPLETLSANEMDFRINGYPYIAPKVGQVPLPFVSPGVMSFGVLCGQLPLGTLSWTNFRPTFRSQPGSFSYAEELTLKAAALSVLATNGAFTGSMQTQRMDSGSAVTNRSLNGVLLQGGSQSGTGLSSDGLPVRIR
ncbi:MAG: Protein of unknown function (DUF1565) [Verrucomicrobia bacterium]|nr:MAG: Protein of unknown function (DUF1565) [Verrucomicrobiota bacterium]